jgi:hypothetical protein
MDQIESNLYHEQVARAQEIVNRRLAELDMESDSELSAMDSSLFNGMEGIETGGVELGEIEMGGTGAGLTDQDGQDGQNSQDCQGGQDGQGDSPEDVGSNVGGGITIQDAGTSPRRTRSGKVVKYKDQ